MRSILALFVAAMLAACSPHYNWRDYVSPDAPYRAMFPDKPASFTRSVNLDGMDVKMTMTATEIDNTMFAIGSAEAPDAPHAQTALEAMKTALVRNIGGKITAEKRDPGRSIDVEASGTRNGRPVRLVGRFVANGARVYQVVVMGPPDGAGREEIDQFLSSFKLQ
ncbi:MAG: hypothetical protein ACXU8N_17210 [Telluria sp.]